MVDTYQLHDNAERFVEELGRSMSSTPNESFVPEVKTWGPDYVLINAFGMSWDGDSSCEVWVDYSMFDIEVTVRFDVYGEYRIIGEVFHVDNGDDVKLGSVDSVADVVDITNRLGDLFNAVDEMYIKVGRVADELEGI